MRSKKFHKSAEVIIIYVEKRSCGIVQDGRKGLADSVGDRSEATSENFSFTGRYSEVER